MTETPANDASSLNRLIAEYLQAEQAGRKIDREELLARHPALAESLNSFFANHDRMQRLANGSLSESPTLPPRPVERDAPTLAPARSGTVQDAPTLLPDSAGEALSRPAGGTYQNAVRYFGDYELLEEIARGGMGVVYKARQVNLNRIVALKMILAGQLASKDDVQRFYTEAEAAANLDHPGIVPIYEVGQHEGQHYFSMGFVEGQSLAARVAAGPLPPQEAAELVKKIAEAIAYAHSKGVIHRDLKPANILLQTKDEGGRMKDEKEKTRESGSSFILHPSSFIPKVTDFGLAKKIETESGLTHTGAILGTPSYMPPEQAAGKTVGALADVYSLGAILYCLLTGRPPFQAASPLDTLLQVLGQEPIAPRQLNPGVPRDLETIALKCLEKDPARRYGSAEALGADLGRYLNHEPIQARPIRAWEHAFKWARRRPAVASLAAAVLVTLVGGAAISTYFALDARARAHDALIQKNRADNKAKESRRHLYVAKMNLVQVAWENTQVVRVWELLAEQTPKPGEEDLRGFEWYYWQRLSHFRHLSLKGHIGPINSVAFSPDGKRLVTASGDHTVKVWDAATGQELRTLKGHTDGVNSVAFSPDGKRLATASKDGTIKVWDAATGQELRTLKGHTTWVNFVRVAAEVNSVAFSADGKWLASASHDTTVKLWDAAMGQELRTLKGHAGPVFSVAFSTDGKRLASGSEDQTVKVWDVTSGQETNSLKGHTGRVRSVAFSADGKRLASASRDRTVKVWDATSEEVLHTLKGHTGAVYSVAFSQVPGAPERLASADDNRTVKVWDTTSGEETFTLKGHGDGVLSVAFSPDPAAPGRLASASSDKTVKVWNTASGQVPLTLKGHDSAVKCVAFSSDGQRLASAAEGEGGNKPGEVKVWNAATGQELLTLIGHTRKVLSVAFSPDGKRLASASFDQTVKVWDATSGQETLTLKGHTGYVSSVAFSPDGKRLASAGGHNDNTVKVWDATSGQERLVLKGHTGPVYSVAFSADGKWLASASHDTAVKVWEATTGKELFTLKGHTGLVYSVAFDADGKRLASASLDQSVKVWEATTGQELLTLKGHGSTVYSVAFSPDTGAPGRLASASFDQTMKLWDLATGQELVTLNGHTGGIYSVAFSPDGKRLASGSQDQTVNVWDATPLAALREPKP